MNPTISWCCTAFYEDWIITRAICQVYNYVDELLIGDGSKGKDFLPKLIKGLPKVKIVPNVDYIDRIRDSSFNLSKWRNYVSSFATGEWILWQDADELYPLYFLKRLRNILSKLDKNIDAIGFYRTAYKTHRREIVDNKEFKIRLWKNISSIKWKGETHDMPVGYKHPGSLNIEYYHDIIWLPPFSKRIYILRDREHRKIICKHTKEVLDKYRDKYPESMREYFIESRE